MTESTGRLAAAAGEPAAGAIDPAAPPGPQRPPPGEAAPRPTASKDYWDIVLGQLARRPSVRIALVLLALLYAVAIYAPFIAGDRPLVIEATDAAGYGKAHRMLVPIASNFRGLAAGGAAAWKAPAPREGEPPPTFELSLGREQIGRAHV